VQFLNQKYEGKIREQEHVLAQLWSYFLHTRGEAEREEWEISDLNQRRAPSAQTKKKANLDLYRPTSAGNPGIIDLHCRLYEEKFGIRQGDAHFDGDAAKKVEDRHALEKEVERL
jgi:hypothetical protein